MQLERKTSVFQFVAKPVLAGLLSILLLCFSTIAANPSLHKLVHSDSTPDSQTCVVCLLAQGQVDSAVVTPILSLFVFSLLFLVAATRAAALLQSDYQLAPSRGPPSRPSSSVR